MWVSQIDPNILRNKANRNIFKKFHRLLRAPYIFKIVNSKTNPIKVEIVGFKSLNKSEGYAVELRKYQLGQILQIF